MSGKEPYEPPVRWQPKREFAPPPWPNPPLFRQIRNGALGLCPACGKTRLFCGYVRVVPKCPNCGAPLGEIRADNAPAYVTLVIVALIIIGALVGLDTTIRPSASIEAAILLPLTLILTASLLRPVTGATIGLMLGLGVIETP
ncbi:MAG: DUF983 domain-containing protein [Acetobacteraceae bacterium]